MKKGWRRSLRCSADDYIAKPFSPTELIARVKANLAQYERLTNGGANRTREVHAGPVRINQLTHRVYVHQKEVEFKNKEYELLLFLVSNPDIVFSKEQLYERIWEMDAIGEVVQALKGVSLEFMESEFVSILGPSGCGKTTLLNIIGGLDCYDEGDLSLGGSSTKHFKDKDWDAYRNASIGFVFQNYNLISHQTILQNVEIALTLSGVSVAERKEWLGQSAS